MPIKVEWYDPEKTIRHWHFIGQWGWDEFFKLLDESTLELEQHSDRVIAVIMDMSETKSKGENSFSMFKAGEKRTANNVDYIVFVGDMFIRFMVNTYVKLNRDMRYIVHVTDTIENAIDMINQYRQTQQTHST